jgi:SRSO17 transposase
LQGSFENLAQDFIAFHRRYHSHFELKTKSVIEQSFHYACGLIQAHKRNMERMVEAVPDSEWNAQQNFATYSPWDAQELMDHVACDADRLIGGQNDSFLVVDESAITKKGEKSVGVARQWNGRLGKVDNCQVGVFTALACKNRVTLVDSRLYLPEEWINDKERCRLAGVPDDRIQHRTKPQLAVEMVKAARANGLRFTWTAVDALYGNDPAFLRALDDEQEIFMADVHCDQTIYLQDPAPYRPCRKSKRGPKPTRLQTRQKGIRVDEWAAQQPESAWQTVSLRESTKGELTARVLHCLVWLWDGKEEHARQWHLMVRDDSEGTPRRKYALSNGPHCTPLKRLAYMQGQRYWVERALQDGKGQSGLAEYQVRTWKGWHHHMAMVMLVQLFMLETKITHANTCQLLSCTDVRILLSHFLPRRDITTAEVIRQMLIRHKQREAATASYRKKR